MCALRAFSGTPPQELEGKPIEVLVPERFRHAHRNDQAEFSRTRTPGRWGPGSTLYARRRDGTEFPVDISLAPIGDDDGSLVVAAVRDITERKATQSAQAQLAAIVRSSTDGIFSMTSSGVMTSWNQAAEEHVRVLTCGCGRSPCQPVLPRRPRPRRATGRGPVRPYLGPPRHPLADPRRHAGRRRHLGVSSGQRARTPVIRCWPGT